MNNYYIYYDEKANINYIYLFLLYRIAEYNHKTKCYDTIKFKSIKDLQSRLNSEFYNNSISISTISRLLNNVDYNNYFTYVKEEKTIILTNNITKMKSKKFILLHLA